jgi:hypothetical protein
MQSFGDGYWMKLSGPEKTLFGDAVGLSLRLKESYAVLSVPKKMT